MTKELTVTTVWWGGKQCFAMAWTFATKIFLESSESWRRRGRWRSSGRPTQRPASSTAVSLITGLPPSSGAVFGWGELPFIASGSLIGSREGLFLLCLGVWAWYEQEFSVLLAFWWERGYGNLSFGSWAMPSLSSFGEMALCFYAADHM